MAEEKLFEERIKKFLTSKGAWFIKYWGGGGFTKSGIPDILACVNGNFLAIEVKASRGRPSELQLYNLRKIDKAGGFAVLLYPDQYKEFCTMVTMIQENNPEVFKVYELLKGRW